MVHKADRAKPRESKYHSGVEKIIEEIDQTALPVDSPAATSGECQVPFGMRKISVNAGRGRWRVHFDMVVLGRNDIVSSHLMREGSWESDSYVRNAALGSTKVANLAADAVFLDIGANLGYYTLLYAAAGHKVLAIEPMTRNRRALEASLCLNPRLKRLVQVVPVALTSHSETSKARCIIRSSNNETNIGNGYLNCTSAVPKCLVEEGLNCEEVPLKTLSAVLRDYGAERIDVVKMDVEEHECQVIEGGDTLFSKYRPQAFQIETQWGDASKCVHDTAAKHHYWTVQTSRNTYLTTKPFNSRNRKGRMVTKQTQQSFFHSVHHYLTAFFAPWYSLWSPNFFA